MNRNKPHSGAHQTTFDRMNEEKRAQDSASELRKALSPHKPLHMHPDLNSKTSAHVIANEEIGDSKNIGSPVDQHLNRMVKARANREMRRNSTLRNQLRNPWSVNGSTNPDLISINADSSTIPKDHVNRGSNKARKGLSTNHTCRIFFFLTDS